MRGGAASACAPVRSGPQAPNLTARPRPRRRHGRCAARPTRPGDRRNQPSDAAPPPTANDLAPRDHRLSPTGRRRSPRSGWAGAVPALRVGGSSPRAPGGREQSPRSGWVGAVPARATASRSGTAWAEVPADKQEVPADKQHEGRHPNWMPPLGQLGRAALRPLCRGCTASWDAVARGGRWAAAGGPPCAGAVDREVRADAAWWRSAPAASAGVLVAGRPDRRGPAGGSASGWIRPGGRG
ncbi:hypothetical protein Kfla_5333 [Kribbella flavida DSM 17836]|uniref:Uncharacterized protein n=1 Tax=Kribbella flavida (strain DSM 17836 / JCM 10339 / NBRC 14399) TaxID=479435 RepID=D2PL91_KRIFD|nr:hypothetical protein Kfla_5333 [Kribbella flavida DSM 17836]